MSRKLNVFTNIIAISLAPVWMGFVFWILCLKDGKENELIKGETNLLEQVWNSL